MLGLILAALPAQNPSAGPMKNEPGTGYYHWLFPYPTGQNAYEDYVLACGLLMGPRFGVFQDWSPKQYEHLLEQEKEAAAPVAAEQAALANALKPMAEEKIRKQLILALVNKTQLDVWRIETQEFGKALTYVQNGNLKPLIDPRSDIGPTTLFPELSGFKNVSRFVGNVAHVDFADGRSDDAITALADVMTQNQRINDSTLISALVSIACQSISFAALDRSRFAWSYSNAKRIEAFADQLLSQPSPMPRVLEREFQMSMSAMKDLYKKPLSPDAVVGVLGDSDRVDQSVKSMANLKGADLDRMVATYSSLLAARYKTMASRFTGDEARWIEPDEEPPPPPTGQTPEAIAEQLISIMQPAFTPTSNALARHRTQVRLLRLHARIMEYRWTNEHLPARLSDVARPDELIDPFSKKPFQYEPNVTGGYRLYSLGFKGSNGEIDLVLRPRVEDSDQEARP